MVRICFDSELNSVGAHLFWFGVKFYWRPFFLFRADFSWHASLRRSRFAPEVSHRSTFVAPLSISPLLSVLADGSHLTFGAEIQTVLFAKNIFKGSLFFARKFKLQSVLEDFSNPLCFVWNKKYMWRFTKWFSKFLKRFSCLLTKGVFFKQNQLLVFLTNSS